MITISESSNVNQSITSFDARRGGGNLSSLSHYNQDSSYGSLDKRTEDHQSERYHTIGNMGNDNLSHLQQSRGTPYRYIIRQLFTLEQSYIQPFFIWYDIATVDTE